MKLKDIDISIESVMMLLYFLWFIVVVNALMIVLSIVNVIALHFFNYKIIIFGIPL